MGREIRIVDDSTGAVVNTIETTDAKFDRVLNGLARNFNFDRYSIDYDDDDGRKDES